MRYWLTTQWPPGEGDPEPGHWETFLPDGRSGFSVVAQWEPLFTCTSTS
jgi:hypothetical protein